MIQHRLFVAQYPQLRESFEFVGNTFRRHRGIAVCQLKVKVGRIGIARVAKQGQRLAGAHMIAELYLQGARLEMRINCESSAAKIENHIVADRTIHSYYTVAPLASADIVRHSISQVRNPRISDREHLRAIMGRDRLPGALQIGWWLLKPPSYKLLSLSRGRRGPRHAHSERWVS